MAFFFKRKEDEAGGPVDPRGLEAITKRQQIIAILREAQKEKTGIEVRLSGRGASYSSVILDVRPEGSHGFIVIDSLIPAEGNALIKDAPFVTASFMIREKGFRESRMPYETSVGYISGADVEGLPAIRLTMPKVIRRNQRREYLRVEPPARMTIRFKVQDREFVGLVANISGGGVGFYVNLEEHPLGPGASMEDVSFDHRDLPEIPRGVVVYLLRPLIHQIVSRGDQFRHYCGAEFKDLEEGVRERIVRYVVEVERMELRSLDRRFAEAVTGHEF